MSTRILVMRHAEKPDDPSDPDLTDAGMARARSLAEFIPKTFGVPQFIFAAAVSKHSARPYETVASLSKAIGVAIDAAYADEDYGALVQNLQSKPKFRDALIVVCWHHGNIPNLIHALGVSDGTYPDPWDRTVFNLILQVVSDGTATPTVTPTTEPF